LFINISIGNGGDRGVLLIISSLISILVNLFNFTEKFINYSHFNFYMPGNKNTYNSIMGKMIVTKEGKRLGFVRDITFETKSGELINLIVKDSTPYTKNLNLERTNSNDLLIPYNAIIAIGDFVIVSEEDLI
jgi:sporulation protein YlmC with PRC-barrel domain